MLIINTIYNPNKAAGSISNPHSLNPLKTLTISYTSKIDLPNMKQVHRPPPEFGSITIQVTYGCPYNKCAFCATFKNTKFEIRPQDEILKDIEKMKGLAKVGIKGMFLAGGNSIAMKTDDLIKILDFSYETLPNLDWVSSNASAKFILKKGYDGLKTLREKGLKKLYMGLETGDEKLLKEMEKGVTPTELIEAAKMVIDSGIELSMTIIIGLGGKEGSKRHINSTAEVLNRINPEQIRLHTLTFIPGTKLYERKLKGQFENLTPEETLLEMKSLISALNVESEIISHRSNYLMFSGMLPRDRDKLVEMIDFTLSDEGRKKWASELSSYSIAKLFFDFRQMMDR